ncbi:MAG: TonB-dependent receptor [Halioglobus sp.]|nr:TonB-dependent receptor [Halioglobus sp.]
MTTMILAPTRPGASAGPTLFQSSGGEIKLRGTYGTGFRAPSLFEIATNQSPFTGPPAQGFELAEEESEGYDLALSWAHDNGAFLELVYFDQKITDEIFFDFNSFGYLQETGDTESRGVEAGGEWPLASGLSVSGNYTYTDSRNIDGDPRPRRPEHMANAGITWTALANRLVLGLHARMSRDAVDVDGEALDDYEVVNINASFSVVDGLELYGRVENVTDEDYEEVPTFNTSGAAGYLGLRYSF